MRTLSVQVTKTLSKNLSCQHENQLLQVATTGSGLGLRGAKVTVHQHVDGTCELLWRKRKLTYSVMNKPKRQSAVADGKSVNARVDNALARRMAALQICLTGSYFALPIFRLDFSSPTGC